MRPTARQRMRQIAECPVCAPYLEQRRDTLAREVLRKAKARNGNAHALLADLLDSIHTRHLEGLPLTIKES